MKISRTAHPNPDKVRKNWLMLNGEWDFSFDEPIFDRKINIPFSWTCEPSGINEPLKKGVGYYRKRLKYNRGKNRLFLIFGGVDYECEVYLNGVLLTKHLGGYARFEAELTGGWQNDAENEIVVKATDFDCDYQTYGKQGYGDIRGIWQSVYVEERPQSYIDSFIIKTKTGGRIDINIKNAGRFDAVRAVFDGQTVQSSTNDIVMQIDTPKLWSPDTPYLYEGYLELEHGGEVDRIYTYFGVREIGTGKCDENGVRYILLNHKPIYLNGVLDQCYNPQGFFTLPDDYAPKKEIEMTKALGLNMTRLHIKCEDPQKLYWADKLGLLVMADIPCFWGEPTQRAMKLFEEQMEECVARDINHPSIFYWVVFNETWGLKTFDKDENGNPIHEYKYVYEKNTQEWVRKCYQRVKQLDDTLLVEDNSPCNSDHVETDVNSWHFYKNGYEILKEHIDDVCKNFAEGSPNNYIGGNVMGDVPIINSECGNYWGIKGNSGDSDISWHYKYMMNEFRLHERICGFVFTEFRDVPNEFNGFYRIDDTKKLFGYDYFVPGMTVKDLHSKDFVAYDCAPMTTVKPGDRLTVPVYISSFNDRYHGENMQLYCECVLYCGNKRELLFTETVTAKYGYGKTFVANICFTAPEQDGIICARLYLKSEKGNTAAKNFCLFDNCAKRSGISIEPCELTAEGFKKVWTVQNGAKINTCGSGSLAFTLCKQDLGACDEGICITFEASSKEMLVKDCDTDRMSEKLDIEIVRGGKAERGKNPNSFYMTDEEVYPGEMQVLIDDKVVENIVLKDDPADCSGALSWHYQAADNMLDEAGSYGYLHEVRIDKDMLDSVGERFCIKFKTESGFSLFGRKSGRYAVAIEIN